MKNRRGFTLIELIFVVVILGALAAVAVPKFVATRTDSQVAVLRSDIATVLRQVPTRVFAENLQVDSNPPLKYQSWGEWLMDTPSLDRGRWRPTEFGIVAVAEYTNTSLKLCEGDYLYIDTTNGRILFYPAKISHSINVCEQLSKSFSSGSEREIELRTSKGLSY